MLMCFVHYYLDLGQSHPHRKDIQIFTDLKGLIKTLIPKYSPPHPDKKENSPS